MIYGAYSGPKVLDDAPGLLEMMKKRAGLPWEEIARSAGVSIRTLHKWRARDGEPDLSDFGRIAKACGIASIHELAEFIEGPKVLDTEAALFRRAVDLAGAELRDLHARTIAAEAERDQLREELAGARSRTVGGV